MVTYERTLRGGGLLVITGVTTITGGILVVEIVFYPKIEQQPAEPHHAAA